PACARIHTGRRRAREGAIPRPWGIPVARRGRGPPALAGGLLLALGATGAALAGPGNPSGAGQPNQSSETTGTTPRTSVSGPGSAFNPGGQAGSVYAGEQPQNSKNAKSVRQYDVACAEQPPKG